ncbi:MAG: hypothetical protein A3F10_06935 [Coxiella sp. RIFCSPHIGHO2_12_FULL_42_15]|nr:MAG: hypothetical protein A3F10_06935 [Coxiella sp. RIFCSPHIGHO2_12_FULL_42_15]
MTTHYSGAEIKNLIDAANTLCQKQMSTPTLSVIQSRAALGSAKLPRGGSEEFGKVAWKA